ncbi:hypothetical protein KIN52_28870 (plasmid) [Klebsiella pneumoniae]|uniref:hypothetical protein n=1 Tax=Klebsiella pneumoniae TaxID=573 RepID=UPI00227A401D|nr:hypothetical protein [Klebsiella pneumoniae]MCY3474811.1 hypothetical protein [Klebsiella pneumoniae]
MTSWTGAVDGWIEKFGDPRTGYRNEQSLLRSLRGQPAICGESNGSAPAIPGTATNANFINQPLWMQGVNRTNLAMMSKVEDVRQQARRTV